MRKAVTTSTSACRATLSVSGPRFHPGAWTLQVRRDRLVPGGAEKYGCLVLHGCEYRVGFEPFRVYSPPPALRRAGLPRHRPRPVCFRSISKSRPRSSPTRSDHNEGCEGSDVDRDSRSRARRKRNGSDCWQVVQATQAMPSTLTSRSSSLKPTRSLSKFQRPQPACSAKFSFKSGSTVAVGSLLAALKGSGKAASVRPSPQRAKPKASPPPPPQPAPAPVAAQARST